MERGREEWSGGANRTSQSRPSDAVCFFVLSSLTTRDWRDSDWAGEESWRSRIFCAGGKSSLVGR